MTCNSSPFTDDFFEHGDAWYSKLSHTSLRGSSFENNSKDFHENDFKKHVKMLREKQESITRPTEK